MRLKGVRSPGRVLGRGQEPRRRRGCSPQSHPSESGRGRRPGAGAETGSPGQPGSRLQRQQVPKGPQGAALLYPACPAPHYPHHPQRSPGGDPHPSTCRSLSLCLSLVTARREAQGPAGGPTLLIAHPISFHLFCSNPFPQLGASSLSPLHGASWQMGPETTHPEAREELGQRGPR